MFENASRKKFRFDSPKGELTVEHLWDIPLTASNGRTCLDDIAKGLNRLLKNDDNISFVAAKSVADETLQQKLDIVKHIIAVRLNESNDAALARNKAEQRQKIALLMAEKKDNDLKGKSLEELQQMYESL